MCVCSLVFVPFHVTFFVGIFQCFGENLSRLNSIETSNYPRHQLISIITWTWRHCQRGINCLLKTSISLLHCEIIPIWVEDCNWTVIGQRYLEKKLQFFYFIWLKFVELTLWDCDWTLKFNRGHCSWLRLLKFLPDIDALHSNL